MGVPKLEVTSRPDRELPLSLSVVDAASVTCSTLSLLASVRVVVYILCSPKKERSKPRNVLLFHTFLTDFFSSVSDLSNLASPAIGCVVPSVGTNLFYLASAAISAVSMVYAWALVSGRRSPRRRGEPSIGIRRALRLEGVIPDARGLDAAIAGAYVVCVAFSVAPPLIATREIIGTDGHWCWLKGWALRTHWPYTTFYTPLWVCIIVICVFYVSTKRHLDAHQRTIERNVTLAPWRDGTPRTPRLNRRFSRFSFSGAAAASPRSHSEQARVNLVTTLSYYSIAMVLIWIFPTARRLSQVIAPSYASPLWLTMCHAICYRLQGLVNSLIFLQSKGMLARDDERVSREISGEPRRGSFVLRQLLKVQTTGLEMLQAVGRAATASSASETDLDADADRDRAAAATADGAAPPRDDDGAAPRPPSIGVDLDEVFPREESEFSSGRLEAVGEGDEAAPPEDDEAPPPETAPPEDEGDARRRPIPPAWARTASTRDVVGRPGGGGGAPVVKSPLFDA